MRNPKKAHANKDLSWWFVISEGDALQTYPPLGSTWAAKSAAGILQGSTWAALTAAGIPRQSTWAALSAAGICQNITYCSSLSCTYMLWSKLSYTVHKQEKHISLESR